MNRDIIIYRDTWIEADRSAGIEKQEKIRKYNF